MRVGIILVVILCVKHSLAKIKTKLPLVNLGESITDRLKNPTGEHQELLLKDFYKYFNMLDDVFGLMRSEDGEDVCKGMAVFDVIEELGGPPHTKLKLDYELLEKTYKWNDSNETEDIQRVLLDTKELWEAMEERANRLRHGIPDPSTEEDDPPSDAASSSEGELH